MKKLNAVLALITDVILAAHIWVMIYSLFTGWFDTTICKALAYSLCGAFCVHAILSICIFFFCHDGAAISCKKSNRSTIAQRASAVLMLLLIHRHMKAYSFMATGIPPTGTRIVITVIAEILFIFAVSAHSAISSSKALVTLGVIRCERTMTVVTRVFGVFFGISAVTAAVAVIRFFAVI